MNDARRFLCARCDEERFICTRCDRGQRYCGTVCSDAGRRKSVHEAARRYRRSERGRDAARARQQRHRERQRAAATGEPEDSEAHSKKREVTHHGSTVPGAAVQLVSHPDTRSQSPMHCSITMPRAVRRCHVCGCEVSEFIRHGWKRYGRRPAPLLSWPRT